VLAGATCADEAVLRALEAFDLGVFASIDTPSSSFGRGWRATLMVGSLGLNGLAGI
jgi:hypothetical protein